MTQSAHHESVKSPKFNIAFICTMCGESCHRPGVATGTGWHWGGIGTIRTNVAALGGLQDWVPVSWDSGEDPPVIIRIDASR